MWIIFHPTVNFCLSLLGQLEYIFLLILSLKDCSIFTCNGVFPSWCSQYFISSSTTLNLLPHLLKTDKQKLQASPVWRIFRLFRASWAAFHESIYLEKTHQEARVQTKASDCKSKCGSILQVCGLPAPSVQTEAWVEVCVRRRSI